MKCILQNFSYVSHAIAARKQQGENKESMKQNFLQAKEKSLIMYKGVAGNHGVIWNNDVLFKINSKFLHIVFSPHFKTITLPPGVK